MGETTPRFIIRLSPIVQTCPVVPRPQARADYDSSDFPHLLQNLIDCMGADSVSTIDLI